MLLMSWAFGLFLNWLTTTLRVRGQVLESIQLGRVSLESTLGAAILYHTILYPILLYHIVLYHTIL